MNRKIPTDAFDFYFSLGPGRSYQAVADKYEVSKRAVTYAAKREDWPKRLDDIERQAREKSDQRLLETLEEQRARHLKLVRVVQGKAVEALKTMPLSSAMDAVRALDIGIKQERVITGEPTERTATRIEDVIREEYDRWMGD